jgi:hypothetical protein
MATDITHFKRADMRSFRYLLLISLFLVSTISQGQETIVSKEKSSNRVSFIVKIDISQATKDGIYLYGYVVNIPYSKLLTLEGKRVRIRGKVTTARGLKYDNDTAIKQGREDDTKHILKPKVKIISSR